MSPTIPVLRGANLSQASNRPINGNADFPLQSLIDAMNASKIGLAIYDRKLRYVAVNQQLADIDGLSSQDHIGKTFCQVLGSFSKQYENSLRAVLSSGLSLANVEVVGLLPSKSAPSKWINNFFPLIHSGGGVTHIGVFVVEVEYLPTVKILPGQAESGTRPLSSVEILLKYYTEDLPRNHTALPPISTRHASSALSPRETEILRLLAEGQSNKEVAWQLGISVKTVESHRSKLMMKLDAPSLVYLVHYAIRNQMVQI